MLNIHIQFFFTVEWHAVPCYVPQRFYVWHLSLQGGHLSLLVTSSRLCCRQVPQEDVPSAVCYQNMNLASIKEKKNLFLKNESLVSPHNVPITISNTATSYWEASCSESTMILERKTRDCGNGEPLTVSFWRMTLCLSGLPM